MKNAVNLKRIGVPVEDIAKALELTEDEIKAL